MRTILAALALVFVLPVTARGQDAPPDINWVYVMTAHVPYAERAEVWRFIENWIVPQLRLNPNLVYFRLAGHSIGANGGQIVFVRESELLAR